MIATGSRVPRDLPVPGPRARRRALRDGVPLRPRRAVLRGRRAADGRITAAGKHVIVIGGGDTGADCVGHSHREGAASVTQIELLGEPPASRPDDLTPWPRWPVKLRTLLRAQGGRRARLRDLDHQADRQRRASSRSTGSRTRARRRSTPIAGHRGVATRPSSCCSRWASCTPSSRCSRRSASRRDARGNAKAGAYATVGRRRVRRRRRAPRPVADRVGDQRGPPVRARGRPLPRGPAAARPARRTCRPARRCAPARPSSAPTRRTRRSSAPATASRTELGARASPGPLARPDPAGAAARAAALRDGYLDLLGDDDPTGGGPGQRLMVSRALPLIYERLWRPLGGRLLMGALGPGMAGERRIALEMLEIGRATRCSTWPAGRATSRARSRTRRAGRRGGRARRVAHDARAGGAGAAGRRVAYVRGERDRPAVPRRELRRGLLLRRAVPDRGAAAGGRRDRARARAGRARGAASSVARGPVPAGVADALVRPLTGVRIFGRDELTARCAPTASSTCAARMSGLAQFVSRAPAGFEPCRAVACRRMEVDLPPHRRAPLRGRRRARRASGGDHGPGARVRPAAAARPRPLRGRARARHRARRLRPARRRRQPADLPSPRRRRRTGGCGAAASGSPASTSTSSPRSEHLAAEALRAWVRGPRPHADERLERVCARLDELSAALAALGVGGDELHVARDAENDPARCRSALARPGAQRPSTARGGPDPPAASEVA